MSLSSVTGTGHDGRNGRDGRGRRPSIEAAMVVLAALSTAWAAACGGERRDAVAVASGDVLTVDQVVGLLAGLPELPADESVVRALADLWVDYTLLAAAARQDPTLASLDLTPVLAPRIEQEMIRSLRRSVIQIDTVLADDELRYLFERDQPGVRVKARHILLHYDMTRGESRDSAIALAAELRDRIRAGADFGAIARQYSRDPGTANLGGDLGEPFPPERMVAPFSEAAFALEPGEISDPVETQFGVHVIRVDRREGPDFDEVKDAFRNAVKNQRVQSAESTWVTNLEQAAAPVVRADAYERVRNLARDPAQQLGRRAADAPLVEYGDGAYTAGEFLAYVRTRTPAVRGDIVTATEGDIRIMLEGLTRGELLVARAATEGLGLSEQAVDSLETQARARFGEAVAQLGLAGGAPTTPIVELLRQMLVEERDVIPLGPIGYVLRDRYDGRLVSDGVEEALQRISEERRAVVPPPRTPDGEAPLVPPVIDPSGEPAAGDTATPLP